MNIWKYIAELLIALELGRFAISLIMYLEKQFKRMPEDDDKEWNCYDD